jgi:hypothetical protein
MQNTSSLPASPVGVNIQYPQLILEGKRTGYYITFTLLIITLWLIIPKKQRSQLEVPFYKASKKNWIFDAETLIKDSYTKVRYPVTFGSGNSYTYTVLVSRSSISDQGY